MNLIGEIFFNKFKVNINMSKYFIFKNKTKTFKNHHLLL